MAGTGRELNDEVLAKAIQEFVSKNKGIEASEGEQDGRKRWLLSPGDIIVQCKDGKLECATHGVKMDLSKIIMDIWEGEPVPAKPEPMRSPERPQRSGSERINAIVQRKGQDGSLAKAGEMLTAQDVINYINPKATQAEAYLFAEFCRRKGADPLKKQVYLAIFETEKGRQVSMIAGKEYFTEKAENHPQFDGFKAGVIVQPKEGSFSDKLQYREGAFWLKDSEVLIGGWAEVHRKDRKIPYRAEVPLYDYNTGKNQWAKMPATMIRKVALVQSLREAFASDLGGMYDRAEMDQAGIDVDFEVRE